ESPLVHRELRGKQPALGLERLGQMLADARERGFGLGEIASLPPDLREKEPRAIVNLGILVVGEQPLENLAGDSMLSIRQMERAEQQLGLDRVRRNLVPLERGREAHER